MVGRATPGLMVLGGVRQQAEEAPGSKPVAALLHGLRTSSCLQGPTSVPSLASLHYELTTSYKLK